MYLSVNPFARCPPALGEPSGPDEPRRATQCIEHEIEQLVTLSTFVVRSRSAVERDGDSRHIELIPGTEAPTRLIVVLAQLVNGLDAIGVERETAWSIVTKAVAVCLCSWCEWVVCASACAVRG